MYARPLYTYLKGSDEGEKSWEEVDSQSVPKVGLYNVASGLKVEA